MKNLILPLFLLLFSTLNGSGAPAFHQVEARSGDGVFSLLRRYGLSGAACNVEKFYSLNRLEKNALLQAGETYFLPVLLYNYAESIRKTVQIQDLETALEIKAYNEWLLANQLRQTHFQDSRILWVPYHIMNCGGELPEPETSSAAKPELVRESSKTITRTYPIFGTDHQEITIRDFSLQGKVYYLIAGHGGPDPGAISKRNGKELCEDEYAYDITLRLARNLIEHGAIVYMVVRDYNDGIRDGAYLASDDDELVWGEVDIPYGHKKRLNQRTQLINRLYLKHKGQGVKEQKLVEIHIDSRSKSKRQDVFFYYQSGNSSSKSLASTLHSTFRERYEENRSSRQYEGSISERNLFTLREAKPASVFVELGNIMNRYDQERFIKPSNRQILADWLFEGMVKEVLPAEASSLIRDKKRDSASRLASLKE